MTRLMHWPGPHGPANSFYALALLGPNLYRIAARVRATDASPIFEVEFWAKVQDRDPRGKDPEGVPVLLMSRKGEEELHLEACRLHPSLALTAYVMTGWSPAS